ncbi:hypothetical protein L345_17257, partial [Ophiophagus hannah]
RGEERKGKRETERETGRVKERKGKRERNRKRKKKEREKRKRGRKRSRERKKKKDREKEKRDKERERERKEKREREKRKKGEKEIPGIQGPRFPSGRFPTDKHPILAAEWEPSEGAFDLRHSFSDRSKLQRPPKEWFRTVLHIDGRPRRHPPGSRDQNCQLGHQFTFMTVAAPGGVCVCVTGSPFGSMGEPDSLNNRVTDLTVAAIHLKTPLSHLATGNSGLGFSTKFKTWLSSPAWGAE